MFQCVQQTVSNIESIKQSATVQGIKHFILNDFRRLTVRLKFSLWSSRNDSRSIFSRSKSDMGCSYCTKFIWALRNSLKKIQLGVSSTCISVYLMCLWRPTDWNFSNIFIDLLRSFHCIGRDSHFLIIMSHMFVYSVVVYLVCIIGNWVYWIIYHFRFPLWLNIKLNLSIFFNSSNWGWPLSCLLGVESRALTRTFDPSKVTLISSYSPNHKHHSPLSEGFTYFMKKQDYKSNRQTGPSVQV